jgi:hypothetical protein
MKISNVECFNYEGFQQINYLALYSLVLKHEGMWRFRRASNKMYTKTCCRDMKVKWLLIAQSECLHYLLFMWKGSSINWTEMIEQTIALLWLSWWSILLYQINARIVYNLLMPNHNNFISKNLFWEINYCSSRNKKNESYLIWGEIKY